MRCVSASGSCANPLAVAVRADVRRSLEHDGASRRARLVCRRPWFARGFYTGADPAKPGEKIVARVTT